MENLSRSISSAKVDLNPHQVDAALFALRSPLSKGVIFADEVGLGKTIEAGLVVSQKWAERRRRILLILPATLRQQWAAELGDKFFIKSIILDSTSFNQLRQEGLSNPFAVGDAVMICSYHFAAAKAKEIQAVGWDLVVMDEAHRLRNVFKKGNKIASAITEATRGRRKLLLTATPLQNSLVELYGLVSVIDEQVFGDLDSFKNQFLRGGDEEARNGTLRERLNPFCTRTLRKQVLEYIRYTQRIPITQDFTPSDEEQELYDRISAYLQRTDLVAIPSGQRTLLTLVLRKLLASSTFAIGGALEGMVKRLDAQQAEFVEDFEDFQELAEEWDEDAGAGSEPDPRGLAAELEELRSYARMAVAIAENAKGTALRVALKTAMDRAESLGAQRKAVIFTESRRTQAYLLHLLEQAGYEGQIVTLNGVNSEPLPRAIYQRWKSRHAGEDILRGSQAVNMKTALVEEFKNHATILLATEAAAEGVNLQFCSLVVNYDLPWNPQRIEQRIGRCHRYGQKHNVVVVNFLNRRNQADQRVFELLSEKFRLFDGVFGASDEVLGALESGVDLEKRIAQVYQNCRTSEEIQAGFDQLRTELEEQIRQRMDETRQALLENFNEEVAAKLRVRHDKAQEALDHRRRLLWKLTRAELGGRARFHGEEPEFELPEGHFRGRYHLLWAEAEKAGATFYREEHPLALELLAEAKHRSLPPARLVIDGNARRVTALADFQGARGQLCLARLKVESVQTEEFLLLAARTEQGDWLDSDQCEKLLDLPAKLASPREGLPPAPWQEVLSRQVEQSLKEVELRNSSYFDEESGKLEAWADDLKLSNELELRDIERQIREARAAKKAAATLQARLEGEKAVKALEARRNKMRRELYEQQDGIGRKRDELIAALEKQLTAEHQLETLFSVQWDLV